MNLLYFFMHIFYVQGRNELHLLNLLIVSSLIKIYYLLTSLRLSPLDLIS